MSEAHQTLCGLIIAPTCPRQAENGAWYLDPENRQRVGIRALYGSIHPSQTRLIRLPASTSDRNEALRIELVVADLVTLSGLRLADTAQMVEYIAISYHWKHDDSMSDIICNSNTILLGDNIIAVLNKHRQVERPCYLWLDALCIDQSSDREKSFQVVNMLDIFRKAVSITAWLGEAGDDSQLACAALREPFYSQEAPSASNDQTHRSTLATSGMQPIYDSLLKLYSRPFLSRTWIRQELFAAKELYFMCGDDLLTSQEYLRGEAMLADLAHALKNGFETVMTFSIARLADIELSMRSKSRVWPIPRELLDVLERSQYYDCSLKQDIVYAVLNMCGVPTISDVQDWSPTQAAFLIDYRRSPNRVFHDLSIRLLSEDRSPARLQALWAFRLGHTANSEDSHELPSWAIDWNARCILEDRDTIKRLLRPQRLPPYLRTRVATADKLLFDRYGLESPIRNDTPVVFSQENDRAIELTAHVIDYVAYVSEYSCTLDYMNRVENRMLGDAGVSIHDFAQAGEGEGLLDLNQWESIFPFRGTMYERRIAILGISKAAALVPYNTRKGDIVVHVARGIFPLVLSPVTNPYEHELYATPDPYETCVLQAPRSTVVPKGLRQKLRALADNEAVAIAAGMLENVSAVLFCFLPDILRSVYRTLRPKPPGVPARESVTPLRILGNITQRYQLEFKLKGPTFAPGAKTWESLAFNRSNEGGWRNERQKFRIT